MLCETTPVSAWRVPGATARSRPHTDHPQQCRRYRPRHHVEAPEGHPSSLYVVFGVSPSADCPRRWPQSGRMPAQLLQGAHTTGRETGKLVSWSSSDHTPRLWRLDRVRWAGAEPTTTMSARLGWTIRLGRVFGGRSPRGAKQERGRGSSRRCGVFGPAGSSRGLSQQRQ